jgi:hypothetical protein
MAVLLGCGSSSTNTSASAAYNFNGEWGAVALSTTPQSMPFNAMQGPLQVANGVVTGTLAPFVNFTDSDPNLCAAVGTFVTVTGTLDANNNIALTFPIAGGTGTLLATLSNDPQTYALGSWQINGGTCAMSVTPMGIKGNTLPAATSSAPITATLSGNWAVGATSNAAVNSGSQPVTGFYGPLQFSSGAITGMLSATINGTYATCQQYYTGAVPVTGTLDASNNLTLTLPISNGTATITSALGANPQTLADGSFQIVGGSCAIAPNTMTIAQYAPLTGTYSGTFNVATLNVTGSGNVPLPNTNVTVTAVLTQSTTANSSGQYPLTGTINVTGACTDNNIPFTGTVTGSSFTPISGPSFAGSFDPTVPAIYSATYTSANCPAHRQGSNNTPVPYSGTLTRH